MLVTGWKLDREERAALLERFPPTWPDVIADHVTLVSRAWGHPPVPTARSGDIVGTVDDGAGLQAMIVAIDGKTDRPDGSTFHITWSIDRGQGRKPVQSNEVIAERGWRPIDPAVPIRLHPGRF